MAKKNNIIEEQRRQREELYKLKRMQQGESVELPVAEVAESEPLTFKKKYENFWYYYKPFVIIGVAFALILALLLSQCAKRINYDMEIVYFTYTPVLSAQLEEATDYFKQYATDINGNGKVDVLLINCSIDPNGSDEQYRNNILTKLQALIVGNPKAMLFITDSESIKYFDNISSDVSLFDSEPYVLSDKFYEKTKSEQYGELPRGLQISCRHLADTALENNKESKTYYKPSLEYLKKFIAADSK